MTRDNVARVIAIAEMISGGVAAPYVIFSNWHVSVSNTSNHLNVRSDLPGAALLLAVVFAASVYAGYELWRGTKIGYRLSVALIGLQVVQIMLPGFQFQLVCPISAGLGWGLEAPSFGLLLNFSAGITYRLGTSALDASPFVSVNGVALVACFYLLARHLDRPEAVDPPEAAPGAEPERRAP